VTELNAIRAEVAGLHDQLVRYGLVVWTAGNISARVPDSNLFVIKPSGVPYEDLRADRMVVCDLTGQVIDGDLTPSSDTASHAYIYRHCPEVGGIVHTHSTYAVAWAARGESVPCVLTAMADEFGGDIPIAPFSLIGDESVGKAVVDTLRATGSSAVLVANHGPFTVGPDARAAVQAAVMCEDVCRTVHIARQLGNCAPIAPSDIRQLHDRYQNVYGQR
jgi:L-ribulose-5-phosphate 4-epimerase